MTLGERIKEIRKDNNLTQKEFAEKLSVSRPFISRIESDKEKPSESLIKLISATFNTELNWIIDGAGYKESERKTMNKILCHLDYLPLEASEKIDFAQCSGILAHLLNTPQTKSNSKRYFRSKIQSILTVLNSFFCRYDSSEYSKEDIDVVITYIEKQMYEAIAAFENEDLDED